MNAFSAVIRVTDRAWDDGEYHDRFVLRESGAEGVLEGWLRHGSDPSACTTLVKAGILADDRATGRLSLFGQIDQDRWHKIGIAQLDPKDHLECTVVDPDGQTHQLRARLLPSAPESLRARLSAGRDAPQSLTEEETRPARVMSP